MKIYAIFNGERAAGLNPCETEIEIHDMSIQDFDDYRDTLRERTLQFFRENLGDADYVLFEDECREHGRMTRLEDGSYFCKKCFQGDDIMNERCPICKNRMPDMRHVGVECFYAVNEFVPDAEQSQVFVPVPEEKTIWGITRYYPAGTQDRHVASDGGETEGGIPITKIDIEQEPIDPIRLLKNTIYRIDCCKNCRSDFLHLLQAWRNGLFLQFGNMGYGEKEKTHLSAMAAILNNFREKHPENRS